jgi:histidinol-phosphate aminotransferase
LPGVEPLPSQTNFVLFRVADAEVVYRGLLERDVTVRRQDHLVGLDGCLRVSAGTPPETDTFLEALQAVLGAEVVGG